MALREKSEIDQLLDEFRKIGRDSEYCPESEETAVEKCNKNEVTYCAEDYISVYGQWFTLMHRFSQATKPIASSQPVVVRVSICSFCRKNGEAYKFYRSHCLKDESNKICCPILRKYVCPICHATGDEAHTLKYCPLNKDTKDIPLITRLKGLRNSMGKRRGKLSF